MIRFARNLPLAALLMAGIVAFSYGAARAISGPVEQVAKLMHAAQQTQTAEAGR